MFELFLSTYFKYKCNKTRSKNTTKAPILFIKFEKSFYQHIKHHLALFSFVLVQRQTWYFPPYDRDGNDFKKNSRSWCIGCCFTIGNYHTLSVKNSSVKSEEFLPRWRIFSTDENFCRRNFLLTNFFNRRIFFTDEFLFFYFSLLYSS